jgi:hypothetical protein
MSGWLSLSQDRGCGHFIWSCVDTFLTPPLRYASSYRAPVRDHNGGKFTADLGRSIITFESIWRVVATHVWCLGWLLLAGLYCSASIEQLGQLWFLESEITLREKSRAFGYYWTVLKNDPHNVLKHAELSSRGKVGHKSLWGGGLGWWWVSSVITVWFFFALIQSLFTW